MGASGKLWNKDFAILWQGQLISDLGNGIFNAILGFWVLDITGSELLMGTVMACLSIPRVLFGPFAGTFADRHSRKWIIVVADLVRGVMFAAVGGGGRGGGFSPPPPRGCPSVLPEAPTSSEEAGTMRWR